MKNKIIYLIITLYLVFIDCYSQEGSLDLSFNLDGKVITPIGSSHDSGNAIALQSDGKIIVAGNSFNGSNSDFALARYNTDGTLDTSFNSDGKVTTNFGSDGENCYSVAIQNDGKIIIAGKTVVNNYSKFILVRYLSDGSLDTTFGNFGNVVTSIGNFNSFARSMVIQQDGKIILAGRTSVGSYDDFVVARYNIDGNLDQAFGVGGVVTTPIGLTHDSGYSVALQSDNKIVVGGSTSNGVNYDFALIRYNENGSLDITFDGDGKLTTDFNSDNNYIYSIAIQNDGKIVVAGSSGFFPSVDFALARYNVDGSLDSSFDIDGKTITSFGANDDFAYSVALQSDNKILVAGYSSINSINNNKDFALARYNSDGSLDLSFDGDGKVTTPIANSNDICSGVIIQDDGKIIVAGVSYNGSNDDFSLARYNATAVLNNVAFNKNVIVNCFPNPVCLEGELHLNIFLHDATLTFVDSFGKQIIKMTNFSGNSIKIDSKNFSNGIYFVQLKDKNNDVSIIILI